MIMRRLLCLGLVIVSLAGLSCQWLARRNYNVDKASPNGVYRVKVKVRVEKEGTLLGGFDEWGKVQFFRGQEVIDSNEWHRRDTFEPTFIEANPVIEWVGDNVLRMGLDSSAQPFLDDLIISNNTGEYLRYANVSYGRYEQFKVFDLAPGSLITLRASPGVTRDGVANHFLGYGGKTQSGKKFAGVIEQSKRKSPADGSLTFQIAVNPQDLKVADRAGSLDEQK